MESGRESEAQELENASKSHSLKKSKTRNQFTDGVQPYPGEQAPECVVVLGKTNAITSNFPPLVSSSPYFIH